MSICVLYASKEGQTARIAEFIAEVMRDRGQQVDTIPIEQASAADLVACDGVVVGASIHVGKHDKAAVEFVRAQLPALERVPSAFFSVSLSAHGDPEQAARYVAEFEEATGWRPLRVARFGGALRYTQYGFLKRRIMKKIAAEGPGDLGTDTSRDYVYTEWDGVTRFAEAFLRDVAAAFTAPAEEASSPA